MGRRQVRSERGRRRACPAPQARRGDARQRHGAGELREPEPKPKWRLTLFHVEVAVIGALTIIGFGQFIWGIVRWIMVALGFPLF